MPVILTINDRTTPAEAGELTLFDYAEQIGVRVPTSCKKQGKCKECIVEITRSSGCLSERTESESHLPNGFRLSCQVRIVAEDGEVNCHTMRRGQMRIERHGTNLAGILSSPGTPGEGRSGGVLSESKDAKPQAGPHLNPSQKYQGREKSMLDPAVTREGDRILLDGVEIERSTEPIHGVAMDLGTTTIVLRLLNLETGEVVADASFENPQRFGGSDVMSRIHYDTEHPGNVLMRIVAGYVKHAIEDFGVDPKTIYEMVIAGNSTMRDIFFRQSVYTIGQNPYRSITEIEMAEGKRATTSLTATAKQALLPIHPKARIYGMPIISGHVGADAAACMLAVDIEHEDGFVAIMDIGTNTELILGNKNRILAASCPAGPAFEGGAIACGMPALDGAIEDVAIHSDGTFRLGVIGDGAPAGICGSGLVDLMSELLRTHQMNELGRFVDDRQRFTLDESHGIFFSERDVNELAQAKGANVAGLRIVFHNYGIEFSGVDRFYLAGGFGRHLKIDASRRIGLIPDLPDSKIVQIGNASIEGACIALLSYSKRIELEELVKKVGHCRLETHPDFFDFFVDGCQFKPIKADGPAIGLSSDE